MILDSCLSDLLAKFALWFGSSPDSPSISPFFSFYVSNEYFELHKLGLQCLRMGPIPQVPCHKGDKTNWPTMDPADTGSLARLPISSLDFGVTKDIFYEDPQYLVLLTSLWKKDKEFALMIAHFQWQLHIYSSSHPEPVTLVPLAPKPRSHAPNYLPEPQPKSQPPSRIQPQVPSFHPDSWPA